MVIHQLMLKFLDEYTGYSWSKIKIKDNAIPGQRFFEIINSGVCLICS